MIDVSYICEVIFVVMGKLFRERLSEKKCTRQSLKVLWVVASSLFFKEISKNCTRGRGRMFARAKGKQLK